MAKISVAAVLDLSGVPCPQAEGVFVGNNAAWFCIDPSCHKHLIWTTFYKKELVCDCGAEYSLTTNVNGVLVKRTK